MSWERYGVPMRRLSTERQVAIALCLTVPPGAIIAFRGDAPWWRTALLAVLAVALAAGAVRHTERRRQRNEPPGSTGERDVPRALVAVHQLLTVALLIGAVAAAGAAATSVAGPRTLFEGPSGGLTIGVRVAEPTGVIELPDGNHAEVGSRQGSVTIAEPGRRALAAVALAGGLAIVAALVIVHQLRAVIGAALVGDPFAPPNARRLRVVGALTIAIGVGWAPVSDWIVSQTAGRIDHAGVVLAGAPATTMIVLVVPGVVMLAVAEVFRWGQGLRDDDALTV